VPPVGGPIRASFMLQMGHALGRAMLGRATVVSPGIAQK